MSDTHIHLLINHFPIILPVIGFCVLITGLFVKKEQVIITSLALFVFAGIITIPAVETGRNSERETKEITEIKKDDIKNHENIAEAAFISIEVLAGLSLINLILYYLNNKYRKYIAYSVLICSIAVIILMFNTGESGGLIRHTELRNKIIP